MSSKPEFVEFVAEQCRGAGDITFKKMFGDYGLYCDGKIFALTSNNQLFIKITKAGENRKLPKKPPYDGAKDYFLVEDVDNAEFLTKLVSDTCKELPEPKPKTPKAKTEKTDKASKSKKKKSE